MKNIRKATSAYKGDDEKMTRKSIGVIGLLALVALMLSTAFASSASAAPAWKFNGEELKTGTSEVILGAAEKSALTIPGLTTSCENFLYELSISNSSGTGSGKLTSMPLFNCYTNSSACTVGSIGAQGLPWSSKLTTVGTTPYIVIEGVKVNIFYEGEECVLSETLVVVTGSAGGSINNTTESATFNKETLSASKTELKALAQKIEWTGVFPTEGFQAHRLQAISAS